MDLPLATKKRNMVEDHPVIIPTMIQFLSDKKIFKASAKQNTLLALAAILDSGTTRPSKEHSYNAKIQFVEYFSQNGFSMKFP